MKTYRWQGLTPLERDKIVADAFGTGILAEPSTNLNECFRIAQEKGIPLNVFRDKEGRVWAGVHHDHDYGVVTPASAACHALLKSAGFEWAEPVEVKK